MGSGASWSRALGTGLAGPDEPVVVRRVAGVGPEVAVAREGQVYVRDGLELPPAVELGPR